MTKTIRHSDEAETLFEKMLLILDSSMNVPFHRYLPPLAIWYWTRPTTQSAVTRVNNYFRYQVHNIVTGEEMEEGNSPTLKEAKEAVFEYVDKYEQGKIFIPKKVYTCDLETFLRNQGILR